MNKYIVLFVFLISFNLTNYGHSQPGYWQQKAEYTIRVTLDPKVHKMIGTEELIYTNNSPDTLHQVFYHLYFNAFQPNSEMDVRSRTIADPDSRVGTRISKLKPNEIGEYFIKTIQQNGKQIKSFKVNGTILTVNLVQPILPGKKVTLSMAYECQVPVQIRRTGRYNKENIAYSMAQWYPKMAEYDKFGWATDPYVGREFYGVWGTYNVFLTVPDSFKIAGTGIQVSSLSTPFVKDDAKASAAKEKYTTYNFKAENVHDFVWAADPHYKIDRITAAPGLDLVFAYKEDMKSAANWKTLQPIMKEAILFASQRFGQYPYKQYSFIQGGDGGMEYPMATLVMGDQNLTGLISVCVHEMMHSWYQGVLGFNESLYPWMDEGFTSYAEEIVKEHLKSKKMYPGETSANPFEQDASRFISFTKAGRAEPLSTHADHYTTNAAYGVASYVKGCLFLSQLGYVVGEDKLAASLLQFYNTWKFKHPVGTDLMNIIEKNTNIELGWYYQYMVNTNDLPDYSIDTVYGSGVRTSIVLGKRAQMPMPIDLCFEMKNGTKVFYTIAVDLMREPKKSDRDMPKLKALPSWNWTNPNYECTLDIPMNDIFSIKIDPTKRMLDSDATSNEWMNK
ncbi:MAG: M1 family metallopeptidase [Saprospiraceae bacterium]|nr:M1 family metallopeptidase [Candidatus Brachybacter algidus]